MEPSSMNETKIGTTEPKRSVTAADEILASSLRKFCGNFKFIDIMSRLQACLRRETNLSLAYISLRLECNERKISRVFECFDHRNGQDSSSQPEIVDHPDGFEFSLVVQDTDSKDGKLNFGIYHHDAGQFYPERIKLDIARLIDVEIRMLGDEPQCCQDEAVARFIHKIRNPLATILVSSSQLAIHDSEEFSEDDRQLAEYISDEAERIDQMLTEYAQAAGNIRENCRAVHSHRSFNTELNKKLRRKQDSLIIAGNMKDSEIRLTE